MPISGSEKTAVGISRMVGVPGLVAEHAVGERMALADRDRRQRHAVGDIADGVDVVDAGARVRIDHDLAALCRRATPALSRPRFAVFGTRPVANMIASVMQGMCGQSRPT